MKEIKINSINNIRFDSEKKEYIISLKEDDQTYELVFSIEMMQDFTELASSAFYHSIDEKLHGIYWGSDPQILGRIELQKQAIPEAEVYIYLPSDIISIFEAENITNACGEFMEALGFELETEDEPVFHSLWKRIKFVFNKNISLHELEQIFLKGKKALELKHIDLPTAEQTEKLATSAEKIILSLEKYEEGVVRLGALIVLKKKINGESKLIVQQLNFELIRILDEKPQILQNLQTVYELLTGNVAAKKLIDDASSEEIPIE